MSTPFTPRSIVPVWFVVVGLIALLQPSVTVTANIVLLVSGGVVAIRPKERRRVVVGAHSDESVIAAQTPAAVRGVPFHAAAHIAGRKRLRAHDPEAGSIEHREPADSACTNRGGISITPAPLANKTIPRTPAWSQAGSRNEREAVYLLKDSWRGVWDDFRNWLHTAA